MKNPSWEDNDITFPRGRENKEINTALGMGPGGCPGRDIKNVPKGKKLNLQIDEEVIRVDSELTSSPPL